jgi:hypothetical protein
VEGWENFQNTRQMTIKTFKLAPNTGFSAFLTFWTVLPPLLFSQKESAKGFEIFNNKN